MIFPIVPLPKKWEKMRKWLYSLASTPPSAFFTFQHQLGKQDGQSGIWTYFFEEGDTRLGPLDAEEYPKKKQIRECTAEGALGKWNLPILRHVYIKSIWIVCEKKREQNA